MPNLKQIAIMALVGGLGAVIIFAFFPLPKALTKRIRTGSDVV